MGGHIECDRCTRYVVYHDVPVTKAKRWARQAGWRFGKRGVVCPTCKKTPVEAKQGIALLVR